MQVIIAGAGPVGLTAGVELIRRGVDVLILDKREAASTLSRAVGINPQSLQLLKDSGVTEKLLSCGIPLKYSYFHQMGKLLAKVNLTKAYPVKFGFNFMLALAQDETERLLREHFLEQGGKLYYQEELVNLIQDDKKVQVHLKSGELIEADFLIGADGVHSKTRQLLGIDIERRPLPGVWSIADARVSNLGLEKALSLYMLPKGGVAIIVPIGRDRYRFVSNTKNVLHSLPFTPEINEVYREGQFTISLSIAKSYQQGRVFLAGDAAHSHSPAGGKGMNLGISDACELAKRLVEGSYDKYTSSRHQEGKKVLRDSEFLRKTVSTKNPIKRLILFIFFKLINYVPLLQKKLAYKLLYG